MMSSARYDVELERELGRRVRVASSSRFIYQRFRVSGKPYCMYECR